MRVRASQEVGLPAATATSLVQQPDGWRWVPGVEEVDTDAREVTLVIRGPRLLRARFSLVFTATGLTADLIEGDLKSAFLSVTVSEAGASRCTVDVDIEITTPSVLPGTLVAEFETVTIQRWLNALASATVPAVAVS